MHRGRDGQLLPQQLFEVRRYGVRLLLDLSVRKPIPGIQEQYFEEQERGIARRSHWCGCLLKATLIEQAGDGAPIYQLIDLTQKGIPHLVPPIDNSDIREGGDFGLLNLAHGDNENI